MREITMRVIYSDSDCTMTNYHITYPSITLAYIYVAVVVIVVIVLSLIKTIFIYEVTNNGK